MYSIETFSANVRSKMAYRRWSQKDLSDASGIPLPSITAYLRPSNPQMPGFDKVVAIADALECTIDELR